MGGNRGFDGGASSPASSVDSLIPEIEAILNEEADLARELYGLASADSRIGYEASNHYYYLPRDWVEKIIQCSSLKNSE